MKRIKRIWGVIVALVQFPFAFPRLYSQFTKTLNLWRDER